MGDKWIHEIFVSIFVSLCLEVTTSVWGCFMGEFSWPYIIYGPKPLLHELKCVLLFSMWLLPGLRNNNVIGVWCGLMMILLLVPPFTICQMRMSFRLKWISWATSTCYNKSFSFNGANSVSWVIFTVLCFALRFGQICFNK